jgi:PAS domain S-box-containing protein
MTSPEEFTEQPDGTADIKPSASAGGSAVPSPLQTQSASSYQSPELRWIYDTAPIGLAFLSPDCRYLQINQRLTEICGISVADHIGRSVRETVPQAAEQVEKIVQLVLQTGESITGIEVNGQRSDNTNAERVWLTSWHPLKAPEGSVVGINVVAEEITERKRSEAALAAAEQRYRALVRATSSLVWTAAADGQMTDMTEWCAYTGQSVGQLQGWGWLDALYPGDREGTLAVWHYAFSMRSPCETEFRIRRRDGIYLWHQARSVAILKADGSIREWVGICVDIDSRKRAIEQQIEAEDALRRLNENLAQDMLVVADAEGKFLTVNQVWTSTLGWSETDLVGNTSDWLLHPDDLKKTRAELAQLAESNRTLRFENRLRHKEGSFCRLSWTAVSDGGLIYAVARDITELRAAEDELRTSRQELARANRQLTMGAMSASIAHEMNQPLAAIVANGNAGLRWLARATPDLEEARAAFKRIVDDGNRASQVIASVRAMFGKDRGEKTKLDLNELIRKVLAVMHAEIESQRISQQIDLSDGLSHVVGDRVPLQQVLLNLIMNAIEAMAVVADRPRLLSVTSEMHETQHVLIKVGDSGTGIDPNDMGRIFDAFFTTKPNGMGLGLPLCRSIVEAHGGRLWASAAIPHGSIFNVVLPGADAVG